MPLAGYVKRTKAQSCLAAMRRKFPYRELNGIWHVVMREIPEKKGACPMQDQPELNKPAPMQTYVMLTRLIGEEVHPTFEIKKREKEVVDKVRAYLPHIKWTANYAVTGPWDYLDVFEARGLDDAMKVSALVRYYGGAHTELWPVTAWDRFEKTIQELAQVMEK